MYDKERKIWNWVYGCCSFVFLLMHFKLNAQNCIPTDTVLNINFGTAANLQSHLFSFPQTYSKVGHSCPDDGQVAIAAKSLNCFNGNWVNVPEDHTAGDANGNLLIVNASYEVGKFLIFSASKLTPGKQYYFSIWVKNIFRSSVGCIPVHPELGFIFETDKKVIARYRSSIIQPSANPQWLKFNFPFTMPATQTEVSVTLLNYAKGGCGNDFAIDDILIYTCKPPLLPEVTKQNTIAPTPVVISKPPSNKSVNMEVQKPTKPLLPSGEQVPLTTDTIVAIQPKNVNARVEVLQTKPTVTPPVLNDPVLKRPTTVVQSIAMYSGNISIQLYDNGQIDGDTVTIFHNGKLLAEKILLTATPYNIEMKINPTAPHHEFIMVANNLGSIPPNTSLMVVMANGKRYEMFISTSEQQNAKIVFDLKE